MGKAIADYKVNKYNPILRWQLADRVSGYIEWARTSNIIKYPNLSAKAEKFDKLEKEHEKLKNEHDKLRKMYNNCLREKDRLEKDNKLLHGFDRKDNKHKDDYGYHSGGITKS